MKTKTSLYTEPKTKKEKARLVKDLYSGNIPVDDLVENDKKWEVVFTYSSRPGIIEDLNHNPVSAAAYAEMEKKYNIIICHIQETREDADEEEEETEKQRPPYRQM